MSEDNDEEYPNIGPEHGHKGGAPEGNENSVKHGLYREDDKLWDSLDDSEKALVGDMAQELAERYEEAHGEDPGPLDQEAMRNMLLDVVKRRRFNEYQFSKDYIDFDAEHQHAVYSTIMGDYYDELEALGIANDPESEKARQEADFFAAQADLEDDEEE